MFEGQSRLLTLVVYTSANVTEVRMNVTEVKLEFLTNVQRVDSFFWDTISL